MHLNPLSLPAVVRRARWSMIARRHALDQRRALAGPGRQPAYRIIILQRRAAVPFPDDLGHGNAFRGAFHHDGGIREAAPARSRPCHA